MARIPPKMSLDELDRILPKLVDDGLPGGGEFLVADLDRGKRTPALIALLVWHGYLPMGGMGMLLPKIHGSRCILPPAEVHCGRKTRRRAKLFRLTVDQAWPAVISGIQAHTFTSHKGDCWLSTELAEAYEAVNRLDAGEQPGRRWGVAFHSVELWHVETGELVAGEIGYTCGSIYSSCTGFTLKEKHPGAGSVQLVALGQWLLMSGFQIWDLGMELDYKIELGGRVIPRREWAEHVRRLRREGKCSLQSPSGEDADAHTLVARYVESSASSSAQKQAEPEGTQPSSAKPSTRASKVEVKEKELAQVT
mmetsp:Transcript_25626/g.59702  ORF Transcript_25626/g.59702 Transcript_25626/m.59702 type:complete len:308 (-) Transcript_25626:237-1160(-)